MPDCGYCHHRGPRHHFHRAYANGPLMCGWCRRKGRHKVKANCQACERQFIPCSEDDPRCELCENLRQYGLNRLGYDHHLCEACQEPVQDNSTRPHACKAVSV